MSARIFGVAGGGLADSPSWAANEAVAEVGRRGEVQTGALLDAQSGRFPHATVIHDVMVPGIRANVDHIVVSGRSVMLIDSKVWAPGWYWSFRGVSYRGREVFGAANKQTMAIAEQVVCKSLRESGCEGVSVSSVLYVWESSGRIRPVFFRPSGCRAVVGRRAIARDVRRVMRERADEDVERVVLRRFLGEGVVSLVERERGSVSPVVGTDAVFRAMKKSDGGV